MTIGLILNPARAARLIEFHARDKNLPGLPEVIDKLVASNLKNEYETEYEAEIQRVVDKTVLNHLMALAADQHTSAQVRAIAYKKLIELPHILEQDFEENESQKAHIYYCLDKIDRFLINPETFVFEKGLKIPNGAPIGNRNY